ncbi:MAG TPA: hypothetical protein VN622_13000 [Clostridia bacterium]|nr:hypothetical protein [Clostridia bacterium]
MVNVLVRHTVVDFPKWKAVFDDHLAERKAAGELNCRIFHNHENDTDLTLLMEWETLDKAKRYMASDLLKNGMKLAGVTGTPEIIYLEEIRALRRTAAD